METRLLAVRNDHQELLKRYEAFFAIGEMLPINKAVFEHATELRAQTALKTPDALHAP
jgi:predicted nucleic acid-binding protein